MGKGSFTKTKPSVATRISAGVKRHHRAALTKCPPRDREVQTSSDPINARFSANARHKARGIYHVISVARKGLKQQPFLTSHALKL
jgi:hypothetical protein